MAGGYARSLSALGFDPAADAMRTRIAAVESALNDTVATTTDLRSATSTWAGGLATFQSEASALEPNSGTLGNVDRGVAFVNGGLLVANMALDGLPAVGEVTLAATEHWPRLAFTSRVTSCVSTGRRFATLRSPSVTRPYASPTMSATG